MDYDTMQPLPADHEWVEIALVNPELVTGVILRGLDEYFADTGSFGINGFIP